MSIHPVPSIGLAIFRKNYLYNESKKQIRILDEIELNPDKALEPNFYEKTQEIFNHLHQIKTEFYESNTLIARVTRFAAAFFTLVKLQRTDREVRHALDDFALRLEAFAYRRGGKHKDQPNEELENSLKKEVLEFKKRCPDVYEGHQLRITEHDASRVRKIARYGTLARMCLEKPHLLHKLFKATIRNLYPVSCFFQYPKSFDRMYHNHMSQLVSSYHGAKLLKCDKINHSLLLQFDYLNQFVDIMREKEVQVTQALKVPLHSIFEDFHKQGDYLGEYTMFRTGVAKWAIQESWKDYLNEQSPLNWYESLPEGLTDVVTLGELKQKFRDFEFEQGDWIVSLAGSRQSVERDINNSHGFTRFYIPQENGGYKVYSCGVYSKVWPKTFAEKLSFIGNTVDAGWVIPDPNHTNMPQRSRAELPHFYKKDDVISQRNFQERLKQTFLDPTLTFAWSGDNCIVPSIKLTTNCPRGDLVLTSISDVKTPPILWIWVKPYTWAPHWLKPAIIYLVLLSIGGFRERHGKSLMNSQKGANFNYPGALHDFIRKRQVVQGREIRGVISGGHTRDYEAVKR